MMQTEFCPLCSKNGAKVRVKAYQLNFEVAVFMCSTDECTWPVGYHELLFMDRPLGRHDTKNWPEQANQFLANHLKKQRDSLSELSAYTPPQTPGHSKDAIHDTSAAGPSSLSAVKEDYVFEQQPSSSENKDIEPPLIDIVDNNEPVFVSSEPVSVPKSQKILVITKQGSGSSIVIKSEGSVANPFPKQRTSAVDKPAVIMDKKPNVCVPEKSVGSESLLCKKYRVIGKKNAKSFTYKKQFDIFDDIRKAKSTNEQCKTPIAIKSKIDLHKMKPKEIKEVLFVNNKLKANDLINVRTESTVTNGIEIRVQERMTKVEKKVCQGNVNNTVEVVKKDSVADSLIQVLDADSSNSTAEGKEVSLDTLSKQTSHDVHYDFDMITKASHAEFESGENWSETDHNLESLLAMLEDGASGNDLLVLNDDASTSKATLQPAKNLIAVDGPLNALALNDSASTSNSILFSKEPTDNLIHVDYTTNDNVSKTNYASLGKLPIYNLMTVDDPMNGGNASSSNAALPDQSIKNKDNFVSKVEKVKVVSANTAKETEVGPMEQEMDIDSIIDDDTLQCSIEETDDSFFASLFSPSPHPVE